MTLAILQLDGVELRTSDPLTCRTLWRLINTAADPDEMAVLTDDPGHASHIGSTRQ